MRLPEEEKNHESVHEVNQSENADPHSSFHTRQPGGLWGDTWVVRVREAIHCGQPRDRGTPSLSLLRARRSHSFLLAALKLVHPLL